MTEVEKTKQTCDSKPCDSKHCHNECCKWLDENADLSQSDLDLTVLDDERNEQRPFRERGDTFTRAVKLVKKILLW